MNLFFALMMLTLVLASCKGVSRSTPNIASYEEPEEVETEAPVVKRKSVKAPVAKPYSLANFTEPVLESFMGSAWCACRGGGSSPHIGQDVYSKTAKEHLALALSDGKIVDITHDPSCGYAVWFEDEWKARWRYLHLDNPIVKIDQVVKAGQRLAGLNNYPTASCGNGTHLHLERRSRGEHPGEGEGYSIEKKETCQYGVRSCYFDPTIFTKNPLYAQRNTGIALANVQQPQSSESDLIAAVPLLNKNTCNNSIPVSPADPNTAKRLQDKVNNLQKEGESSRNKMSAFIEIESASNNQRLLKNVQLKLKATPNAAFTNSCRDSNPAHSQARTGSLCVNGLRVYSEINDQWSLVSERTALRGEPAEFTAKHGACVAKVSKSIAVVIEFADGSSEVVTQKIENLK